MRAWWKGLMLVGMLLVGCGDPEPAANSNEGDIGSEESCTVGDKRTGCTCDQGTIGFNTCTEQGWGSACFCHACSPGDKKEECECETTSGHPAGYQVCTDDYEWGEECLCVGDQPVGTPCDDKLECTSNSTVQPDGSCRDDNTSSACDDQVNLDCATTSCSEEDGCTYHPKREGLSCNEDDPSTIGWTCSTGECVEP